MELKKKNGWRDVIINEYYDLKERLEDDELTPYEKEIARIAFVNNISEDEAWNLQINEFRKLQVEALWLNEFNLSDKAMFKNITINGEKYEVDVNLQNFTVAQYIDFQTFYPKRKTNERIIGNILACFIIPKGKKYAEGYDINKVVNDINNYLDIMTANEILFFFLKQYLISIRATANYFNWQMKRMKKKLKNSDKVLTLEKEWVKMKQDILVGLRLSTMSGSLPETNGMTSLGRTFMNSSIS